jgi:uncharacterized protein YegL
VTLPRLGSAHVLLASNSNATARLEAATPAAASRRADRRRPSSRGLEAREFVAVTGLGGGGALVGMTDVMSGGAPGSGASGQGLQFTAPVATFEGPAGGAGGLEGPAQVGEIGIAAPGLIVLDVSWSMERELARAQAALDRFRAKLRQNGMAGPIAYLGIVTFADTARTDLQLIRIADPSVVIPELAPRGNGTNFHAAFTETLSAYRSGLPLLLQTPDGGKRQVFRPSVYFVSDGEHNTGGDWTVPLAELKSRSWKPNVFAFGYRDADPATIRSIASEGLAYFAEQGQDPDTMFDQILEVILRSMISATVTAQTQASDPTATAAVAAVDPKADPATKGLALIDPISSTID